MSRRHAAGPSSPGAARKAGLPLLLAALALSGAARGATERPLTIEEMTDLSDEVVVAKVVSSEARFSDGIILTVSSVAVEEDFRGNGSRPGGPPGGGGRRVEITQVGGTAVHPTTGISMTMSASTYVALEPGDDVLLFVHRTHTGLRQIVGAQQGRFLIRANPKTGAREIPVGPKRLQVTRGVARDAVATEVMTLDEMRARVRKHLARQRDLGGRR